MQPDRPLVFTVGLLPSPARLDAWLVERLGQEGLPASRSSIQLWIEHGRVRVEGVQVRKGATRIKTGATVEVTPEPPPPSDAIADPTVQIDVVWEDPHLLVVNKPAGLVVHPARGHASGTLVNGLLARGGLDEDNADPRDPAGRQRPGIVHRIDKDTSGLLVVARTPEAREGLKALFSRHDIERLYRAVVVGEARDATYDTLHGRHPTDRLRFSTRVTEGRRAVTHVRVLESFGGRASLVACTLETGRTHQIRVHLAECGHTPVLGDPLYGAKGKDALLTRITNKLQRHWLHAAVLGFVHPITGAHLRFESPDPPELAAALAELRASCAPRDSDGQEPAAKKRRATDRPPS